MSELLGITVEELVASSKERQIRIPSEIGAFVAFEVCESLLTGPASPGLRDVRIADDGSVAVFAPPGSATSEEASHAVVALLGGLLVAAGTGVPRLLVALLEHGPSSGRWDLPSLRDDLEASLVPLNRAAARRVLSRMLREVKRGPSAAPSLPSPREQSLDAQLDDLLGGGGASERTEEPDPSDALDAELDATLNELSMPAPVSAPKGTALEDATIAESEPSLLDEADRISTRPPPATPETTAKPKAARREPTGARRAPAGARPAEREPETLGGDLEAPREKGSVMPWVLAFFAILAATGAALALMRPDLVDEVIGRPPPPPAPEGPTAEDQARLLREHRARFGTLTVRVASEEPAQVLMFVGRGPARATDLPTGVAHEFVAIAEGRAPTRAVVPADATWEPGEGGPTYELAMQAGSAPMAAEALALGPTQLPRDVGQPSTTLGAVRVITNPPGARVFLLVGFSPEVVVENVRTDEAIELMVYGEGHAIERALVGPSDWLEADDGAKTAFVSVTLAP